MRHAFIANRLILLIFFGLLIIPLAGSHAVRSASLERPARAPLQSIQELVPLQNIKQIAAGGSHTCALTTAGNVKCWGYNYYGQLGNGNTTNSSIPLDAKELSSSVNSIGNNTNYTCALTNTERLRCWGDRYFEYNGVTAMATGRGYICILITTGSVQCQGANYYGQLGNGTTTYKIFFTEVSGLSSGVIALAAGTARTCALMNTGGVKCWGRVGASTTGFQTIPTDVTGLSSGVTALAIGNYHSCALMNTGGVKCWGGNNQGQLGDGTTIEKEIPVDVDGLNSGIRAISAGDSHICALTLTGSVKCWGSGIYGQLGNNNAMYSSIPVDVSGLNNGAAAITTGDYYSCTLLITGNVKCWGLNRYGQLGNGESGNSLNPVDVSGLGNGVNAVRAGSNGHTCALTTERGVKCWGYNESGQLGNGNTTNSSTPVDVIDPSSEVASLTVGDSHTCVLTTMGGVKCWGNNYSGQLGNGGSANSASPVNVIGLDSGVAAISSGSTHTCALSTTGGIKCWGDNLYNQLGNGGSANSATPVDVLNASSRFSAINSGKHHTCALTTTGGAKCWGHNDFGQLGNGSLTNSSTPVDVVGLSSGISSISAGGSNTCALTTTGSVKCWGYNYSSQLGNGGTTNSSTPVEISSFGSTVTAISVGSAHICALTTTGGVKCWGSNVGGQLGYGGTIDAPTPVGVFGLGNGIISITAGGSHTCALTTIGGVKCWGDNYGGQLGNGTAWRSTPVNVVIKASCYVLNLNHYGNGRNPVASPSNSPDCPTGSYTSGATVTLLARPDDGWQIGDWAGTVNDSSNSASNSIVMPAAHQMVTVRYHSTLGTVQILPVEDIIDVSVGWSHACALTTGGGVKCWGDGSLGNSTRSDRTVPIDVTGLTSGVTAVTAGQSHTCALTISGSVKCWGANSFGQLGNGNTDFSAVPVHVAGLTSGAASISTGSSGHACAVTMTGAAKCWGRNDNGQLGNNSTVYSSIPVDVVGMGSGVAAITTGDFHTCALTVIGSVKCWGSNGWGTLGNGSKTESLVPVDVVGLSSGVRAISAGSAHTCALMAAGGVKCWGDNWSGRLGNGSTSDSDTPVDVIGLGDQIRAISAGWNTTCALTITDRVQCWGGNRTGELGTGTNANSYTPINVTGLGSGVRAISTGGISEFDGGYSCAVISEGGIKCWGTNNSGQLGIGYLGSSDRPVDVVGLTSGVKAIDIGGDHGCALTIAGDGKCWGANWNGQLGNESTNHSHTPVDVVGLNNTGSAISAGYSHTCALTSIGGVKCWGSNWDGQLGTGDTISSDTPRDVSGLNSGVNQISVGGNHTCVLTLAGGVKCWGENNDGQLGIGTTVNSNIAVDGLGLSSGMSSVSAGANHSCALTGVGNVKCWGLNDDGQLGNGNTANSNIPVNVLGLTNGINIVSAGGRHTCVLTGTGGVKCWGANWSGQLGNSSTVSSSSPVDVTGLTSGVIAINASPDHTCALTNTGGVKCWGENRFGQLGNGSKSYSTIPVNVIGLNSGVIAISSGGGSFGSYSCALTTDGSVKCWGYNGKGQLGDGNAWRAMPVDVMVKCYPLSLSHTGSGNEPLVIPANSSGCPIQHYYEGTVTTLTVSPALGYQIANWTGTANDSSTASQITLTMPAANHRVVVNYAPICYNLALNHTGSGSDPEASPVNSPGCATNHYHIGTTINLVSVPANGWRVQGWLGTSHNTSTTLTNSVTMPAAPYALTVAYQEIPLPSVGDAYEPDASCAAAQPISSDGTTQAHTFHQTGDGDWLQFAVKAGNEYLIDVTIPIDSPADVALELFDDCAQPSLVGQDYTFSPGIRMRRKAMHDGFFWLSIVNHDAATAGEHVRYEVSVRNLSQASQPGALIIVAGKIRSNDPVDANIYYVTDAVRQVFIDHEYDDERIRYLAPDLQHANVDGLATAVNLQSAITSWAADKVDGNHALTIYLMDHGSQGYFFLDKQRSEWVTPEQLSGWLDTLEASRPGVKINVIIEACYSGSFVHTARGLSKPGRVIITSTDSENLAYASDRGAFFSDYLLNGLRRGESLLTAFREAQLATSIAHQAQVAWMDGDGNRQSDEPEDRRIAAQRGFSFPGTLPDDIWPPYIAQVQPPQISAGRGELRADVRDDLKVADVWAVIYPPSYTPPVESEALVQESLQTIKLLDQGNGWYGASYPGFTETGLYRIVLYAEDEQQLQARPVAIEVNTGGHVYLPLVVR